MKRIDTQEGQIDGRLIVSLVLAGAFSWLLLAWMRLRNLPVEWWRWRDDAVITLSHARNLAESGFIGVSPGVDRVEGFSAPLQFLVGTLYYGVGGDGYRSFLDIQMVIGIAVSGALVTLILLTTATRAKITRRLLVGSTAIGTIAVGLMTIGSWTTFAWLVSGMENPYILVLGLTIIWMRLRSNSTSVPYLLTLGLLIALLGLSRIELPMVMLPVVVAVAASRSTSWSWSGFSRDILIIASVPVALWGLYQIFRFAYFGQLLPNTALVQDKVTSAQTNAIAFIALSAGFFIYLWLSVSRTARSSGVLIVSWLVIAIISGLTWLVHTSGTFATMLTETSTIAISPSQRLLGLGVGGNGMLLALLVLLSGLQAVVLLRRGHPWPSDPLFASLAIIPLSQFLLFGPARLEPHRILSLSVPFLALWAAATFVRLLQDRTTARNRGALFATSATISILGLFASITAANDQPVEDYCCWVAVEQEVADVSENFSKSFLTEGILPITASPDLGKLTFRKTSIHVDLGSIGDPLLTRIWLRNPELVSVYLNEVVTPDVVQSHAYWSREYKDWFGTPNFEENWTLVNEDAITRGPIEGWEDTILGGRTGFWIRSDSSEELRFTRELATSSDPVSLIESEIATCGRDQINPFVCAYVMRSVWRNSLALQTKGTYLEVVDAIKESPSAALDKELLVRSPGWAERAYREFASLTEQKI